MLCRMDRSVIISSSITSAIRKSLEIYKRIPEGKRYKYPLPQSFRFFKTANGDNIFHILVEDHRMLKRFCKNFEKYIASFDDK